jgi:hypothetical protein
LSTVPAFLIDTASPTGRRPSSTALDALVVLGTPEAGGVSAGRSIDNLEVRAQAMGRSVGVAEERRARARWLLDGISCAGCQCRRAPSG